MQRQWPDEFLKATGKIYAIEPWHEYSGKPPSCPNCNDAKVMMAFYALDNSPTQAPQNEISKVAKYIPGMGWVVGEIHSLPCPVCQGDKLSAWLRRNCGLEGALLTIRIEQFLSYTGKERAREVANELLATEASGVVTYYGGYGVGKTMLLAALVNGFRDKGLLAVYTTMADMLGRVRETFGENSLEASEELINTYKNVRVLAIDEFDRVNMTPWASETVFRVVDYRYRRSADYLTVFAANADPRQIGGPLAYLASRLTEGQIVEVGGADVRPLR